MCAFCCAPFSVLCRNFLLLSCVAVHSCPSVSLFTSTYGAEISLLMLFLALIVCFGNGLSTGLKETGRQPIMKQTMSKKRRHTHTHTHECPCSCYTWTDQGGSCTQGPIGLLQINASRQRAAFKKLLCTDSPRELMKYVKVDIVRSEWNEAALHGFRHD